MGLREELRGTWFDRMMNRIGQAAEVPIVASGKALGGIAHVVDAPRRAVVAAGHAMSDAPNAYQGSALDYILYGFDPETGKRPEGYGELLGEAIERDTDLPVTAADAARVLGEAISNPLTLQAGISAARAVPTPATATPRPVGMAAQGQVYPQYAPAGAIGAPPVAPPAPPVAPAPPMPAPATGGAGGVGGIPYTHLYRWFRG